jgi:hypothetical protein
LEQAVWQVTWVVVQAMVHVVLAPRLAPGACAAKSGGVMLPTGGVGGTKQVAWQVAACELQVIMHDVVVELCADAPLAPAAVAAAANIMANHRMTAGLRSRPTL